MVSCWRSFHEDKRAGDQARAMIITRSCRLPAGDSDPDTLRSSWRYHRCSAGYVSGQRHQICGDLVGSPWCRDRQPVFDLQNTAWQLIHHHCRADPELCVLMHRWGAGLFAVAIVLFTSFPAMPIIRKRLRTLVYRCAARPTFC